MTRPDADRWATAILIACVLLAIGTGFALMVDGWSRKSRGRRQKRG